MTKSCVVNLTAKLQEHCKIVKVLNDIYYETHRDEGHGAS